MLVALGATGWAGYTLYSQLGTKKNGPLMIETPPPVQSMTPPPVTEAVAPVTPVEAKEETKVTPTTRNILFRFQRTTPKSVFIVGDFNKWKRQPLKKKEKGWEISVALEPGQYSYMFVVDERRVKDPSNKILKDGKSVITVKPLTP